MLSQLTIKNFGLIDHITLEFNSGLNILTGETGAGKSILIDALRCSLGERMDTSFIRDHKDPCFIETVLDLNDKELKKNELLSEFLNDNENQLIIQRSHTSDGKNKIKINGLSVTLGQLRSIGNFLIDFHGPHDHQRLLSEDLHLVMLDQLIEFKDLKEDYRKVYIKFAQTNKQLAELNELARSRERDIDLLSHQVKELETVPLIDDKYEELRDEATKIQNAQKLNELIQQLLILLNDDDNGASNNLRKSFSPLRSLTQIDPKAAPLLNLLNTIQEQTNDLTTQLDDYMRSLDLDPNQSQLVIEKIDTYHDIKRKYGPTLDQAQKNYLEAKEKLNFLNDFEANNQQLRAEIITLEKDLKSISHKITNIRQKAATALKQTIETELKELGISHIQFEVKFEKTTYHIHGSDKIAFYISPNAGEDLKPLAQIVSSGEAARVMLALKKALVAVDPIPVLIFDEIDAQIGGRLGTITGKKLKELSKIRQVILITHLPQIASFADCHFKVVKSVRSNRATTTIIKLDNEHKIDELAQMLDGKHFNKTTLIHAQEMLSSAQRIR